MKHWQDCNVRALFGQAAVHDALEELSDNLEELSSHARVSTND